MAEQRKLMVQMVDLLGVWPGEAKVGSPPVEEPVMVITVRPEPTKPSARIMSASLGFRPNGFGKIWGPSCKSRRCSSYLPSATGCSARVDVERENWSKTPSMPTARRIARRSRLR